MNNILLFVLVLVLFAGCSDKKAKEFASNNVEYPSQLPEHRAMVKYLAMLKKHYFNSTSNRYASKLRADSLMNVESGTVDRKQRYEAAFEYLSAGETTLAVNILEQLLDERRSRLADKEYGRIRNLLAIAYLRAGEQLNCVSNHVPESCILPIDEAAIYTEQEATKKAYTLFAELAREDSENVTAVFLLNVAAMNLGLYPNEVPEDLLIKPEAFESEYPLPHFANIAISLGVDEISASGGVITEDFNNDGLIDIVTSSWFLDDQVRFFMNNGDGTFTDKTEEANLKGITGGLNILHADYNNDGFRDILIPRGGWWNDYGKLPNSLLKNNGDGTFTDVTKRSGIFSLYPTQTATFADFNKDGWLDLFIGNETRKDTEKYPCELFIGNGDGTFTEMAEEAGVSMLVFAKGVAAGDYNNDGKDDIVISSQGQNNFLLRNDTENDKVKFTDVTAEAGIAGPVKSFPVTFLDYDQDGWEDIFIFTYDAGISDRDNAASFLGKPLQGEVSVLYHNNGDGTFTNRSGESGIEKPMAAMGFNYGDLDNDGWIDLYVGTGTPEYTSLVPNKMFRNNKGQHFQDVTTAGGFGHLQKGHGIGFADFDNDGDQDIYEDMGGGYQGDAFQGAFYENPGTPGNNWVTLRLTGTSSNRDAIGARVELVVRQSDGTLRTIRQTVRTGGSFGSSSLQLETGLGNADSILSLHITWPSGESQELSNLPHNTILGVVEGEDTFTVIPAVPFRFKKMEMMMDHSEHMM